MKRTRFFTLLLALLLCVSVLCMTAYAESDAWDGRTSEAFADGDGSERNPYQIANGAQLSRDNYAKHALWLGNSFFRLNYFLLY